VIILSEKETEKYNTHYNLLDAIHGDVVSLSAEKHDKMKVKVRSKAHRGQFTKIKGDAFCFISKAFDFTKKGKEEYKEKGYKLKKK